MEVFSVLGSGEWMQSGENLWGPWRPLTMDLVNRDPSGNKVEGWMLSIAEGAGPELKLKQLLGCFSGGLWSSLHDIKNQREGEDRYQTLTWPVFV